MFCVVSCEKAFLWSYNAHGNTIENIHHDDDSRMESWTENFIARYGRLVHVYKITIP